MKRKIKSMMVGVMMIWVSLNGLGSNDCDMQSEEPHSLIEYYYCTKSLQEDDEEDRSLGNLVLEMVVIILIDVSIDLTVEAIKMGMEKFYQMMKSGELSLNDLNNYEIVY